MTPFSILSPHERFEQPHCPKNAVDNAVDNIVVNNIRLAVAEWRKNGYKNVSKTSLALLNFWFNIEHSAGNKTYNFFFSQREAIESIIYFFEVENASKTFYEKKLSALEKADNEIYTTTYVNFITKLATQADKTKVMVLTLVWAYFNKLYESDNRLSKNFVIITPNSFVLNQLINEFDGLKMFFVEPFLPDNGFDSKDWRYDFQPTLHIDNDLKPIYDFGNIFLTDVQNLNFDKIIQNDIVKDSIVLNIEESGVRYQGPGISKIEKLRTQNAIIISDFSLAEAIKCKMVKSPVLPDETTQLKFKERNNPDFIECARDLIDLGVVEWKKQYEELKSVKSPMLFVLASNPSEVDEVAQFLENNYPEMKNAVLALHTNNEGAISLVNKDKETFDKLLKASDDIAKGRSNYKAVVSVLNLRAGWEINNVTTIVGLQTENAELLFLPEQILEKGLNKMFSSEISENLVVLGTPLFLKSIEKLKSEGIVFQYSEMGLSTNSISPLIVEIDSNNLQKDLDTLNIKIPVFSPRLLRAHEKLALIDESTLKNEKAPLKIFNTIELEEIVFSGSSFKAVPKTIFLNATPDYRNILSFFTIDILTDCQLERGFAILYPKVENFIKKYLFNAEIEIAKAQTMRNLAEPPTREILKASFKKAIDDITVIDNGFAEIKNYMSLVDTKLQVAENSRSIQTQKSVFNKIVCDSDFEHDLASQFEKTFLDVTSFAKNTEGDGGVNFKIEYQAHDGNIRDFYPTFFVKTKPDQIYIIETNANGTIEDIGKINRLITWCIDANAAQTDYIYTPIYILQEKWKDVSDNINSFADLSVCFKANGNDNLYLPIAAKCV